MSQLPSRPVSFQQTTTGTAFADRSVTEAARRSHPQDATGIRLRARTALKSVLEGNHYDDTAGLYGIAVRPNTVAAVPVLHTIFVATGTI